MLIDQTQDSWRLKFKTLKYDKSKDLSFNHFQREQAKQIELKKLAELNSDQMLSLWTKTTIYGPYVETTMSAMDFTYSPKKIHDIDCPKSFQTLKPKIDKWRLELKYEKNVYQKMSLAFEIEEMENERERRWLSDNCTCVKARGTNKVKEKCNLVRSQKQFNQKGIHNFWNSKVISFQTLTFKQNIKDINEANVLFKKYMRALERKLKKLNLWNDTKYVNVYEYQQRGAVHYHLLWNIDLPELANELWVKIAGNGTLLKAQDLKVVKGKKDANENIVKYFSKYLAKDFEKETSTRVENVNTKSFRFSKSCTDPIIERSTSLIKVRDILEQIKNGTWSTFVIDINRGREHKKPIMNCLWFKNVIDTRRPSNQLIPPNQLIQQEINTYIN